MRVSGGACSSATIAVASLAKLAGGRRSAGFFENTTVRSPMSTSNAALAEIGGASTGWVNGLSMNAAAVGARFERASVLSGASWLSTPPASGGGGSTDDSNRTNSSIPATTSRLMNTMLASCRS